VTREEYAGLFGAIKRVGGRCLDNGGALEAWLTENPQADPQKARGATPGYCAPMPSVDGNPAVDRDNPFWDGRYWEKQP
jgi:hypothetical protein